MNITFDKYHKYDEIRAFLQECVAKYPALCRIECIGKSYEGREIQMLEVTNRGTGPGEEKPGVYTDANHHAGEVTGCEVVLFTIKKVLEGYGSDPVITSLVDTRVFYFIPRITVDGSEAYLTTPHMLRSSTRPWPESEIEADARPGLHPDDVDGDGKILQMRIKNPDGNWKVSRKDPRLMVRRRPHEMAGPDKVFYDLLTEGFVHEYDADLPVNPAPGKYRLDFNRQYPTNWTPPARQPGSGDYPLSEPEIKAVADFYLSHPNIVTVMAYHTSGGFLLRPFCTKKDSQMEPGDLRIYKALAEVAREVTGYPTISLFEDFAYDQSKPPVGSPLEWGYEALGILVYETELWDMRGRAGIPRRSIRQTMALSQDEQEDDWVTLLRWQDKELGGSLFTDWRPFTHPQLGQVEIGGWEPKMGRQNPPPSLLEDECRKNAGFTITRAAVTPRLVIEKAWTERLSADVYKVEAVVKNEGYLPTHATFQALKMQQGDPVKIALVCPTAKIVAGKAEQNLGHLGGRAGGGDTKAKVSWVLEAQEGSRVGLQAWTPRAGKVKTDFVLGEDAISTNRT